MDKEIIEIHHGDNGGFSRHCLTLYSIALGLEAKSILEVGVGNSTITLIDIANRMSGSLTSVDINDKSKFLKSKNKNYKRWNFIRGNTLEVLPKIKGPFDLFLHDAAHDYDTVNKDMLNVIPKMKKDSIILMHDAEFEGSKGDLNKATTDAFDSLNCKYSYVTLPYGYGLSIFRVFTDMGNGKINPTWQKK